MHTVTDAEWTELLSARESRNRPMFSTTEIERMAFIYAYMQRADVMLYREAFHAWEESTKRP